MAVTEKTILPITELIQTFASIVGAPYVITSSDQLDPLDHDETEKL